MRKVIVITRSFQPGKNEASFDIDAFKKHQQAFKKILRIKEVLKLIVVTCGSGELKEIKNSKGILPTMVNLKNAFSKEISSGRLIPHVCTNWGNNAGSATALNDGLKIAQKEKAEWIMNWSPEIECDGHLIYEALSHAERYNLFVVGALRQSWWERPQWAIPQNTLAIWNMETLVSINGFSEECNGAGTISTEKFGKVPLAGMEDFHAMLRIMKKYPEKFRFGMIRRIVPLRWDTNFKPNSEREIIHLKKVARQYLVMQEYAKKIFPDTRFNELMDYNFFAKQFIS